MTVKALTSAQAARLPAWHAHWRRRMEINTAPADRARAEAAIVTWYRRMELGEPAFVWVDSPQAAQGAIHGEREGSEDVLSFVGHPPAPPPDWGELPRSLFYDVRERLGSYDPEVQVQIRSHESAEFDQMTAWFAGVVRGPYAGWGRPSDAMVGCTPLIRAYACLRDLAGVSCSGGFWEWIDLRLEIASSCGWWWPYRRACVISERPSAIHTDPAGRLHAAHEPAVRYRDGRSLHVWHGTGVPSDWIQAPKHLDVTLALTWPNTEQRRALAEIIGWERVLEKVDARTIDKDPDPAIGELIEVTVPGRHRETARLLLKVRCGTQRDFVLSVPPGMRSAREANAWTYGLQPDEYQLEVRT